MLSTPLAGVAERLKGLGVTFTQDATDMGPVVPAVLDDTCGNLIQIAHNVHIGAHTAMAGCAAVAGSARIGRYCTIGGDAKILGHLTLADHVHVSAASVVTRGNVCNSLYTAKNALNSAGGTIGAKAGLMRLW